MKVYVFGGDKDACIELANQLNDGGASALIAKSGEDLKDVAGKIGKAFDSAVMVSSDPIRDSVSANRDVRIKAAICYNQKTLKAAASAGVNLFILEPDAHERLDLSDIIGTPISRPQPQQQVERAEPQPKKEQKRQPPPQAPEPRPQQSSKGDKGGVGGRLKDLFGIEE